MRQFLSIPCAGEALAATFDGDTGTAGLLIVSGGTEIRSGAHGGMARLAARCAAADFPTLRYDRRGVGDSSGEDPGFAESLPDLRAATEALRKRLPKGTPVYGFGLCDGATTLALHHAAAGLDGLLLANPWVVEPTEGLPPPAAIRRRYAEQLTDLKAWRRVLTGGIDYRAALKGLTSLARPADTSLSTRVAAALRGTKGPLAVLLARGDATAIAFETEWKGASFAALRASPRTTVTHIESDSHTFAAADGEALAGFVLDALRKAAPAA
jgi:exosortase A-associated hydrolase 1